MPPNTNQEWERCDDHSYWWIAGDPERVILLLNPLEGRLFWFRKKEYSHNWRAGQVMLRRSKFNLHDINHNPWGGPELDHEEWGLVSDYLDAYYKVRRGPQSYEGNHTVWKYSLKKEPTSKDAQEYLDNLIAQAHRTTDLEYFLRAFFLVMENQGVPIGKRDLAWFWESPPESWEHMKWEMAMRGDRTLSGVPLECAVEFAGATSDKF